MVKDVVIKTVKDLKEELNNYSDDEIVVVQMIDGEYDRVGFIDLISTKDDNPNEYYREYCLPLEYKDAVLLICGHSAVSSQY